ncbi:hypothetical protein ABZ349_07740 [Streptomyces niveus]|uniref:hypothetical protein n=1 Tax=Streptomyces niveus TaxID=193462 RepID=UPI0033FA2330
MIAAGAAIALSAPNMATASAAAAVPAALPVSVAMEQPMGAFRAAGQCTFGKVCGRVLNADNRIDLLITSNWYYKNQSWTWRVLKPGQDGRNVGVKDVDGLWVGRGCRVKTKIWELPRTWTYDKTFGHGWHRVKDHMTVKVYDTLC